MYRVVLDILVPIYPGNLPKSLPKPPQNLPRNAWNAANSKIQKEQAAHDRQKGRVPKNYDMDLRCFDHRNRGDRARFIKSLKANYPSLFNHLDNDQIVLVDCRDIGDPSHGAYRDHLGVHPCNAQGMSNDDAWVSLGKNAKGNPAFGISRSSYQVLWMTAARTLAMLPINKPLVLFCFANPEITDRYMPAVF